MKVVTTNAKNARFVKIFVKISRMTSVLIAKTKVASHVVNVIVVLFVNLFVVSHLSLSILKHVKNVKKIIVKVMSVKNV